MNKLTRVGILCPYWFPEGPAATNRIKAYSRGFLDNGVEVDVIKFFPRSNNDPNPNNGNYEGIQFEYINNFDAHNGFIRHTFDRLKIIINTYVYLKRSNRTKPYDFIFFSFDEPVWLLLFGVVCRILRIKNVFVSDEFPDAIRQMKAVVPMSQLMMYKLAFWFIDARILMTKALQKFYDKNVSRKPTFILSSIVDTHKFDGIIKHETKRRYICYMGSIILVKDNVDNIIKAFSYISDRYPDVDFYIYGPTIHSDYQTLKEMVISMRLENRVIFKGWASFSSVPQILCDATILVTSQPNTKRAEGGFPTKMGEYMMSHTPMIVTDVGEITHYVTDKYNAFVVRPSNPHEYADAISFVLENPDISAEVANRAFAEASTQYSGKTVVKPLITFLQTI